MKKAMTVVLLLALVLGTAGCSGSEKKPAELWVVTEETTGDGMNYIAGVLAERFAAENPGTTIRLETIPTDEAERESYLDHLRIQIAAGDGPDAYLLPSVANLVTDTPKKSSYYSLDSLFPDVHITMGNRQFADLSAYYDQDTELDKDGLLEIVMDAGVRDGKRYVLPLRFDMLVYCVIPALLEGVDTDCFRQDMGSCLQAMLATGDAALCTGAFDNILPGYFTDMIDYETGEIQIERDTLLRCAQLIASLPRRENSTLYSYRIHSYLHWLEAAETMIAPVRVQSLSQYLDMAAIGQAEGVEMEFLPLRSMEGKVTATVEYYAAVDSSCVNPKLAYEYLRLFLLEDAQWDRLRRQPAETQFAGAMESSWPVRAVGSVPALWENYRGQLTLLDDEERLRLTKLKAAEPETVPADNLMQQIETVHFNTDATRRLGRVLYAENLEEAIDSWFIGLHYSLTEG